MNQSAARAALFLLVGTLAGCEQIDAFLPTLSFDSLQPEAITFERAQVDFVFQVDNPNPVQVGLSSFSYDLGLMGMPLLNGDNEDGFTLEASNASELRLPVDLGWRDLWDTLQVTRGNDFVDFGLKGHFGFDTPLGEARLPYDEGGDFPALRTPKFSLKNLRVARLNTSNPLNPTAELELDLGVDHEQGATMIFDAFDYGVQINGRPLASGLINSFAVQSQEEGNLVLPIDINLVNAGTAIMNAVISGGAVDVGLNANMDVDTPFGIVPLSIDQAGNLGLDL